MPHTRATPSAPAQPGPARRKPAPAPTVEDVVDLLDRFAAADRDLAAELDRLAAEPRSSRRVCQTTVTRLLALLEHSLMPGVRARADLDALPASLRCAGIARWAHRAIACVQPRPIQEPA